MVSIIGSNDEVGVRNAVFEYGIELSVSLFCVTMCVKSWGRVCGALFGDEGNRSWEADGNPVRKVI